MAKTKVFRKKTLKKCTGKRKMSINCKKSKGLSHKKYSKNKTKKRRIRGGGGDKYTLENIGAAFKNAGKSVKRAFISATSKDPAHSYISTGHLRRKR